MALGVSLSACNVTRFIPSDAYFLQKAKIEEDKSTPRDERVKSDDVTRYLRQKPNIALLMYWSLLQILKVTH